MKTKILLGLGIGLLALAYLKRETIKNLLDMQLSKNFWLREFTKTSSKLPNEPNEIELINIKKFVKLIAQPVRDLLGVPMQSNSGFRSKAVNEQARGVENSQHRFINNDGALDFVPIGMKVEDAYKKIYLSNIPFDQLIIEPRKNGNIIHISMSANPRRQALIELVSSTGKKSYQTYTT